MPFKYNICIIGGFGHVGLPLGIAFAEKGYKTCIFDIAKDKFELIKQGRMPFVEEGSEALLKKNLSTGRLIPSLDPNDISKSENIIITIGTPVNSLWPKLNVIEETIFRYNKYLRDNQLLILRSTLFPGTTSRIFELIQKFNKEIDVAFCPERIVEGKALKELTFLPQIISSPSKRGFIRAKKLFSKLTKDIIEASTLEAELGKLFSNAWRYIKFAIANQFYVIANESGLDYSELYQKMNYKYDRNKDLPSPGFAAGPCLFKDTVQLNFYAGNNFSLGTAALLINDGLPYYIVSKLKEKYNLKEKKIGILGMSFKPGVDDPRDSLSYKLVDLLKYVAKSVNVSDPLIPDPSFVTERTLIKESDIIIVATPHKEYKNLVIPKNKVIIDIWNFYGKGNKI